MSSGVGTLNTTTVPAPPPRNLASNAPPAREFCYGGQSYQQPPGIEALADLCIRGMTPLLPTPTRLSLEEGETGVVSVVVTDPEKCVRLIAAGAQTVRRIDVTLVDRGGVPLGRPERRRPFAVIDGGGAICPEQPGEVRAVVVMTEGSGTVDVQLWQAR